ncbi:GNAT superfamily N-acetyltransferase [Leucobacter exalbidus]|uniref:GNAT superfamily N-acetyltransferase n=1 Tax=Leucobacter exalbidus TaxID=662960 RepID=A0A940PUR0_9MICO|nr:GNAT family N-acetyltransferase [Leucobacter exalbidus]MBP1327193.1 GNAT superfamily N-acetyltransferase [Leucobacter exalbidus]
MSPTLSPLAPEDFPEWLERSTREYASDLVSLGNTREAAEQKARTTLLGAFPEGHPTAENAVFHVKDEGSSVIGYAWVGRDYSEDPTAWWVWDILIEAEHRGKGYGRAGMQLAEGYARSHGAATLGLSVFGFNTSARKLYDSLGYETTSIKMRKNLAID